MTREELAVMTDDENADFSTGQASDLDKGPADVHVPAAVNAAIDEFLFGGQPAAFFYMTGPAMLSAVHRVGAPRQRLWAKLGIGRHCSVFRRDRAAPPVRRPDCVESQSLAAMELDEDAY
jgi:hypothetical protein